MDQSQVFNSSGQFIGGYNQGGAVPPANGGQFAGATAGVPVQNQGGFVQQSQGTGFAQGDVNNMNNGGNSQRMFTQEDINNVVQSRVNERNTVINTLTAEKQQAEALANQYLQELNKYRQRDVLRNEGIPENMYDWVAYEAGKNAVNGKTFETAVKEFKAANSGLFQNQNTVTQTGQVANQTPQATGGQQVAAYPAQGNNGGQQTGVAPGYQATYTGVVGNAQGASQLPNNSNQFANGVQQVNVQPQVYSGSTGMDGVYVGVNSENDFAEYVASRTKLK